MKVAQNLMFSAYFLATPDTSMLDESTVMIQSLYNRITDGEGGTLRMKSARISEGEDSVVGSKPCPYWEKAQRGIREGVKTESQPGNEVTDVEACSDFCASNSDCNYWHFNALNMTCTSYVAYTADEADANSVMGSSPIVSLEDLMTVSRVPGDLSRKGAEWPYNSDGYPVWPLGPDGQPEWPTNSDGGPEWPTGSDGEPAWPIGPDGTPAFPLGPDGKYTIPTSPLGVPEWPIDSDGHYIVPTDEDGKLIWPSPPFYPQTTEDPYTTSLPDVNEEVSTWAIIGYATGGLALLILAGCGAAWCDKRLRLRARNRPSPTVIKSYDESDTSSSSTVLTQDIESV